MPFDAKFPVGPSLPFLQEDRLSESHKTGASDSVSSKRSHSMSPRLCGLSPFGKLKGGKPATELSPKVLGRFDTLRGGKPATELSPEVLARFDELKGGKPATELSQVVLARFDQLKGGAPAKSRPAPASPMLIPSALRKPGAPGKKDKTVTWAPTVEGAQSAGNHNRGVPSKLPDGDDLTGVNLDNGKIKATPPKVGVVRGQILAQMDRLPPSARPQLRQSIEMMEHIDTLPPDEALPLLNEFHAAISIKNLPDKRTRELNLDILAKRILAAPKFHKKLANFDPSELSAGLQKFAPGRDEGAAESKHGTHKFNAFAQRLGGQAKELLSKTGTKLKVLTHESASEGEKQTRRIATAITRFNPSTLAGKLGKKWPAAKAKFSQVRETAGSILKKIGRELNELGHELTHGEPDTNRGWLTREDFVDAHSSYGSDMEHLHGWDPRWGRL